MQSLPYLNYTDGLTSIQTAVIEALASGLTLTAAAAQCNIHRSTIYCWLARDQKFQTAATYVRRDRAATLADAIDELQQSALNAIRDIIEDPSTPAHLRLRAAVSFLQRNPVNTQASELPDVSASDFPDMPSSQQTSDTPVPRNAPCPCGSGDKYKRCCGQNAPPVLNAQPRAA